MVLFPSSPSLFPSPLSTFSQSLPLSFPLLPPPFSRLIYSENILISTWIAELVKEYAQYEYWVINSCKSPPPHPPLILYPVPLLLHPPTVHPRCCSPFRRKWTYPFCLFFLAYLKLNFHFVNLNCVFLNTSCRVNFIFEIPLKL